ncbi:hypothetical protein B0H14DRAFT_2584447 [Mycena olivaceomarginata]|nr:hypothetical protein B0H14DRAFT_2584447 [Mycena olivaceomarginata]
MFLGLNWGQVDDISLTIHHRNGSQEHFDHLAPVNGNLEDEDLFERQDEINIAFAKLIRMDVYREALKDQTFGLKWDKFYVALDARLMADAYEHYVDWMDRQQTVASFLKRRLSSEEGAGATEGEDLINTMSGRPKKETTEFGKRKSPLSGRRQSQDFCGREANTGVRSRAQQRSPERQNTKTTKLNVKRTATLQMRQEKMTRQKQRNIKPTVSHTALPAPTRNCYTAALDWARMSSEYELERYLVGQHAQEDFKVPSLKSASSVLLQAKISVKREKAAGPVKADASANKCSKTMNRGEIPPEPLKSPSNQPYEQETNLFDRKQFFRPASSSEPADLLNQRKKPSKLAYYGMK